ncbi:MAG: helix-turn-helix domain-containing protein [Betaproteobacteria bacterium]
MSLSKGLVLQQILDRVTDATGTRTDSETAVALGVTPQTFSNWKTRGTVPFESLCEFADEKGLTLDYLLFGIEPKFRRRTEIDAKLLGLVGSAVESMARSEHPALTFFVKYWYIGLVYNRLLRLPENVRAEAAMDEVAFLFSVMRANEAGTDIERLMENKAVARPQKKRGK